MKKLFTIVALVVASVSFAQLKVTDVKNTTEVIGEYKILGKSYAKLEKLETLCVLTYRDEKYAAIDNYKSFYFRQSDIDALYDLLTNYEGIEKGAEKRVDLENGDRIDIHYKKLLGKMYARVYHTDKAGVMGVMKDLTAKQYQDLFGK